MLPADRSRPPINLYAPSDTRTTLTRSTRCAAFHLARLAPASASTGAVDGRSGSHDRAGAWSAFTNDESAALLSDLSAYSLQALQADLMDSPELCFDLSVFNMALQRVAQSFLRPCDISVQWAEFSPKDILETKAAEKIQKTRDGLNLVWMNEETEADMFRAFQSLTMPDKLAIHAFCVAQSLRSSSSVIAELVKEQINFDLSALWQPTKENYFKRVKREKLLDILVELKGTDLAAGMANAKKRDLAELLDGLEESKGWLPPQMRPEAVEG